MFFFLNEQVAVHMLVTYVELRLCNKNTSLQDKTG